MSNKKKHSWFSVAVAWNENKKIYCMPKKGSNEYKQVKLIYERNKKDPRKSMRLKDNR